MQAVAASVSGHLRPCSAAPRPAGQHVQPFRSCGARRHGAQAAAPARRWQRVAAAEGEAATPESLTAVQELDALIDALLAKKGAQELAQAVAGVCRQNREMPVPQSLERRLNEPSISRCTTAPC